MTLGTMHDSSAFPRIRCSGIGKSYAAPVLVDVSFECRPGEVHALIIAVLQTGLAHVGATEPTKRVITGAVIIVAVLADALRNRWSAGDFILRLAGRGE